MFVSIFFPVFLAIVIACYFCVRPTWRAGVLLVSSYLLCGFLSMEALVVLVAISIATWLSGIGLEKICKTDNGHQKGKVFLGLLIGLDLLIMGCYKYIPYLISRFAMTETWGNSFLSKIVMPIGLSFYVFQAISYLVDIYKGKCAAERNLIYLGLYFGFFAKLISGPIERKEEFISQIKKLESVRFMDRGRLSTAFTYLLWGYFMKMVVADRLAVIVEKVFEYPAGFDSLWLLLGAFFYSMQIYSDFAGYSNIAIGCGKIFGLHLTQNFNAPYMARSISDFWRRWHISLSSWLRDYLYIPLGGNRKGVWRKHMNTMIVFFICGIWHGTGLNFVVWGILHGIYSVVGSEWEKRRKKERAGIGRLLTFLAVMFAWIFFGASGVMSALEYITQMLTLGFYPGKYALWLQQMEIPVIEIIISFLGIGTILLTDWICDKRGESVPVWIQHGGHTVRYAVFYIFIIIIFVFGMYGSGYHAKDFIYMQF